MPTDLPTREPEREWSEGGWMFAVGLLVLYAVKLIVDAIFGAPDLPFG